MSDRAFLSALEFRSNNGSWQPILEALRVIIRWKNEGLRFMPAELAPTGTIPGKWRETVVGDHGRLNVISYEICLLTQLRERIRAKEIWIVGADKYRNPDDDLPQDFEERRGAYFKGLGLPQDAQVFIAGTRNQLEEELHLLNATISENASVRLNWRGDSRIRVTPFAPAPEPQGLVALKSEVPRTWPMTGLLDVLKETALETGFLASGFIRFKPDLPVAKQEAVADLPMGLLIEISGHRTTTDRPRLLSRIPRRARPEN